MQTASRAFLAAALALSLQACTQCGEKATTDAPPKVDEGAGTTTEPAATADAPVIAEPVAPKTMADLHPIVREAGEESVVPASISIELARPFTKKPLKQKTAVDAPDGTIFTLEPPVEGKLMMTTPTTLVFTPDKPFAYGTTYKATLSAVGTGDDVIKAAGPNEVFTRTFTTPSFELVRLGLHEADAKKKRVVVDVVFAGPVDPKSVAAYGAWKIAGATLPDMPCGKGDAPNVARCTLSSRLVDWGATVQLTLKAGVPSVTGGGKTARGATQNLEIPGGETISIFAAAVRESASGFVVDVVCSDDGAGDASEYYWHPTLRQSFENLSPRCVVDEEDALEKIHITPKTAFSVAAGDHGFRIFGDFGRGAYTLRIDAGLSSVDKGVLKREYDTTFTVPAKKPKVSFVAQGRYLPRAAWRSLALRHVNAGKAEVTVRHVPPENLVYWMSDGDSESADTRDSNVVAQKQIVLKSPADQQETTWVDVGSWLPATTRGVVEVQVRAIESGAVDTRRLVLTDMNLVAKKSKSTGDVWVWALGIEDNRALSGVEVKQVAPSGRTISVCKTDASGGCMLKGPPKDAIDKTPPLALVAQNGADLTYLKYDDLKADVAESAVQGLDYAATQVYRAAVWTDRGVYRPGETAHVAMVLRDRASAAPPADMPIEIQLLDPQQKVAKKLVVKANAAGVVAFDQSFSDYADTGTWRVLVLVGGKQIEDKSVQVEEFVPERMKVTATSSVPEARAVDPLTIGVSAQYLFGGSAKGSKFEVQCQLVPTVFAPRENAQLAYGAWRPRETTPRPLPLGTASGTLNEDGEGSLPCAEMQKAAGFEGAARLVAKVSVFEAGSGRTTMGEAVSIVHPEKFYLGLQSGTKKVESGKDFSVSGLVVDWAGKKRTDIAEVELVLYRVESEYRWAYDEQEGSWRTFYDDRLVVEKKTKVAVKDGAFAASFAPGQDASAFVVRAKAGGARTDLVVDGNWYDWYYDGEGGDGRDRTPRPTAANDMPVKAPESVKVGEDVKVKTTVPFKGRVLFAAETDGVVVSEWKDVNAGEIEWTFRLPKFQPTVYVTAFAVKDPHLESKEAFTPERAFGVVGVRVEPVEYTQPVVLTAPKEVRSNSKLDVKLSLPGVQGPTFVTVAAVDEGILSLTRFKSPDPLADVFQRRGLGVDSFETIGWNLLLPAQGPSSATGGDQDGGMGRVQPVKPVALWSGLLEVPASGELTVSFDVPQYRGSLRVMAVAVGQKKMGSASTNVLVRDPIVLQTTLPRFLVRGDEAQVPVFVTNLSGKEMEIDVRLTAEPLAVPGLVMTDEMKKSSIVDVKGPATHALHLQDQASGTVVFVVKALVPVGAATLRVKASGKGGLESFEDLDVPFASSAPKVRTVQRVELQQGANDMKALLQGWMPTTEKTRITVTNNPYADVFDHLTWLLRYPYGCVEQTTSATRPLLYLGGLVANVDPAMLPAGGVETLVMAGVERVLSMQTPSGGFGYWPGDREPVLWATAYATHMLIDAKKQKYAVPQGRIDEAVAFMEGEVTNRFEKETSWNDRWWDDSAEPYMHYVLAIAGHPRKARIEKVLAKLVAAQTADGERAEHVYMLKAALWLAGDRRYENDLKNPDASPLSKQRKHGWSFYSDMRRRGMELAIFGELFGADPAGEKLADLVVESLRGHPSHWYTTQELVWSITGVGRRVPAGAKDWSVPVLKADGRDVKPGIPPQQQKTNDRTFFVARASEYGALSLQVDKKDAGALYAIVSSEGVKPGAVFATGGDGLSLTRTYKDSTGDTVPLSGGAALGDVVYVEIVVRNTSSIALQNLALVDRFPSGFEIENPRLGRSVALSFVQPEDLWEATYMNLRDDRIEVFGGLLPNESKKVVYALRAVTAGTFSVPPVELEAMYDPALWAREAGGEAVISGPWAEFLE